MTLGRSGPGWIREELQEVSQEHLSVLVDLVVVAVCGFGLYVGIRKRRWTVVALCGVLLVWEALAALSSFATSSRVVRIPGTTVFLDAPRSLFYSKEAEEDGILGLVNQDRSVLLVVTQLPQSFSPADSDQFVKEMADSSATVEILDTNQGPIRLVSSRKINDHGVPVRTFSVITGDPSTKIILLGVVHEPRFEDWRGAVRNTIASVFWDSTMEVDPFERVDFTVDFDETLFAPFAVPTGIGFSARSTEARPVRPFMQILRIPGPVKELHDSISRDQQHSVLTFALRFITGASNVTDTGARDIQQTGVGGLNGYRVKWIGQEKDSGLPVEGMFAAVLGGDDVYVFHGMAPPTEGSSPFMEAMERMLRTFKLKL